MRVIFTWAIAAILVGCTTDPSQTSDEFTKSAEASTYEWKMVTSWPKNFPALGIGAENLATMVDEMSAGRLKIKVYGANELTGSDQVFDTVSAGTAELGHGAAYYWVGKAPIAPMFTTVPFGMTAQEMNGWLHYGGGIELWRELYEPFNLIPLAAGNSGVQMAGWFNREINSLEDLKGLKMRIPGLGGDVMSRVGVVTVNIPGSEIFTSLQTGAIDATEWVGPYNDLALGLHTIAEYYYYPGWHEPSATIELIVNKDVFEELPADLQRILEVAARAVNQDMLDEFTARNNAALKTLVEEHGVKLRRLPDDVLRELRTHSTDMINEIAGDDPLAQRIVDSYQRFQADVREWGNISELAYLNAREAK